MLNLSLRLSCPNRKACKLDTVWIRLVLGQEVALDGQRGPLTCRYTSNAPRKQVCRHYG